MNIIKLNATDSTNTYLKQLVRETSVADRTIVIAENQIRGRGQRGNGWISKQGQSLTFSMFKCFDRMVVEDQFKISMAVSLALIEALNGFDIPKLSIKWPNDILSDSKKIGGILIETALEGSFSKYAIIGIGINVNELSFSELPQASSLKLQTGHGYDLEEVLDQIVKSLIKKLDKLEIKDFSKLKLHYESLLFRKDKVSVFKNPDGSHFNGIIKGITNSGEMLMEPENGILQPYQMKQVKLIF